MTKSVSHLTGSISLVLAIMIITMSGTNLIDSPDIGYHLDYGYRFFHTLRPVDSSPHLYTVTDKQMKQHGQLPPGTWRDHDGNLHFPNANWISQLLFAFVYSKWGFNGLSLLGGILIFTAACFTAATMWRAEIPRTFNAVGIVLITLGAFERFSLRPEMVAFAIISAQLYLLMALNRREKRLTRYFAGLVLLHLVFVNTHSYWILGLGLTFAFFADSLIRQLFSRGTQSSRKTRLYLCLFVSQALTSLINPWGWRLAVLPLQTGLFFFKNQLTLKQFTGHPWHRYLLENTHPWSVISEFLPTFHAGFLHSTATWAFLIILFLCVAGMLSAIAEKAWWSLIILIGVTFFSLTLRRNLAPAAFILIPVSMESLNNFIKRSSNIRKSIFSNLSLGILSLLFLCFTGLLSVFVVSNRFPGNHRYGLGPSYIQLPLGCCDFLSATKPKGRVWTDYKCSGNVRFFTDPHPDVPVLTNTWAMPVSTLNDIFWVNSGRIPLEKAYNHYQFQVAVLTITPETTIPIPGSTDLPIVSAMLLDSRWDLVYIDVLHVVFVRNTGENKNYANTYRVRLNEEWLAAHIEKLKTIGPVPVETILAEAYTLRALGCSECFTTIYEEARKMDGFDRVKQRK